LSHHFPNKRASTRKLAFTLRTKSSGREKANPRIIADGDVRELVKHVNWKYWWHVAPDDPKAYGKRGKFFTSTYGEAEFYGRYPESEKVTISRPIIGDEPFIQRKLLGRYEYPADLPRRFELDAEMRNAGLRKGYDSIVLMSPSAFKKFKQDGSIPRSLELDVLIVVEDRFQPSTGPPPQNLSCFWNCRRSIP